MPLIRFVIWVVFIVGVAIAVPFAVDLDPGAGDFRLIVSVLLSALLVAITWMRVRINDLQQADAFDERDVDRLYGAVHRLSNEVWGLLIGYLITIGVVVFAMFIRDMFITPYVRWLAYCFFVLSILSLPAIVNIDRGINQELHRRRKEALTRMRRKSQLERLNNDEPLTEEDQNQTRRYNDVLNGD